jgi:transcriptional regulator with XRE-family HTH domain
VGGPYFKEWRKERGFTQERVLELLAEFADPQVPQTGASLSRLENHHQIYTQRSLEALAKVYGIEPGEMFILPPAKDEEPEPEPAPADDGEVVDLLKVLTGRQRRLALRLLETLREEK